MGSEDVTSDEYGHEHEMDECVEFSGRHKQFIKEHLDLVKKQCREFKVCRNELYSQENLHILLQGGDIDLNLICRFLYPTNQNSTDTNTECTSKERSSIKEDICDKLKEAIELEEHHSKWEDVKECLHNNTEEIHESSKHLDQICSLAAKQDTICNTRVHHKLESFLNHQLEHIQCTCSSIRRLSPRFPFKYRLAAAGGGLLFLILLIICVVCMCRRQKKNKKKRKSQMEHLQRVNYHISPGSEVDLNNDHYSVCEESIRGIVSVAPPQLPPRYTKYPREKTDPSFNYLLPADLPQNSPVPDKGSYLVDRGGLISPDGASIEDITGQKDGPRKGYDPLGPRSKEANYSKPVSDTNVYMEPHPGLEKDNTRNTYFILEGESQGEKQTTLI